MRHMNFKLNREKLGTAFLIICCLIVAAGVVGLYFWQDKEPPSIVFPSEQRILTPKEYQKLCSGNLSCLLDDVTIEDNSGDDLSDRVIVRQINMHGDFYYFSVDYQAMDLSNNMASRPRFFYLPDYDPDNPPIAVTNEEEQDGETAFEENDAADGDASAAPEVEVVDVRPHIGLSTDRVELSVGSEFNYADYINALSDDRDSFRMLSSQISVDGWADLNTPGVYQIYYFVTDSEGNQSDSVPLTIAVVG